jgi:hypothetical protein
MDNKKMKKTLNTIRNTSKLFIAGLVFAGLTLSFTACSNVPTAPGSEEVAASGMNLIALGDEATSLSKLIASSALVTPENGGTLILMNGKGWEIEDFENVTQAFVHDALDSINTLELNQESRLFIKLDVPPRAVDTDTTIHLEMDDKNIDMEFGPHGLEFNRPAMLTIIATRLNLKDVNTETLNVYYDNPNTGQWEKMEGATIKTDKNHGFLIIQAVQIPHFSRYAVAWSR